MTFRNVLSAHMSMRNRSTAFPVLPVLLLLLLLLLHYYLSSVHTHTHTYTRIYGARRGAVG